MAERRAIINSLLDQARDKDLLDNGNGEIFAEDAKMLREAAMLLNMDADLRGQYEKAIQANEALRIAQEPLPAKDKDIFLCFPHPMIGGDPQKTGTGTCPKCGNYLMVGFKNKTDLLRYSWCDNCGQKIEWRDWKLYD